MHHHRRARQQPRVDTKKGTPRELPLAEHGQAILEPGIMECTTEHIIIRSNVQETAPWVASPISQSALA